MNKCHICGTIHASETWPIDEDGRCVGCFGEFEYRNVVESDLIDGAEIEIFYEKENFGDGNTYDGFTEDTWLPSRIGQNTMHPIVGMIKFLARHPERLRKKTKLNG